MKKDLPLLILTLFPFSLVGQEECISGNCVNGQEIYTWAYGDKYVGKWKDSKHHGLGTYTFADGAKYVGEWENDKVNIGVFYPLNGEPESGIFADDGTIQTPWTIEAVSDYLKNKYPQFTGLPPTPTTDWAKILAYALLGVLIVMITRVWDNWKKKVDNKTGKPL